MMDNVRACARRLAFPGSKQHAFLQTIVEGRMGRTIADELARLALGETAALRGARITRRSLLGFQLDGGRALLDPGEIAERLAALPRAPALRIALCARCAGDGRGRRNRGACGLCHGPGIQVIPPFAGWDEASPEELALAVDQALSALREARYPQARGSLLALLSRVLPAAPVASAGLALGELRRQGLVTEAEAIARAERPQRAA
jgi:hypothetical protein